MTLKELYIKGKEFLKNNIQDSDFDNMCIFEYIFGADRQFVILNPDKIADTFLIQKYFECLEQRKNGRPLQYIIGKWEFYGNIFFVGEGVLIPREDTAVVVDECLRRIKNINTPKVIDLCCGSGTIAVTLANIRKDGIFYGLELSADAYNFLEKNKCYNNAQNLNIIKDNVLFPKTDFDLSYFDAIASNPPYISTNIIPTLQKEVQQEPIMALDGGIDGLDFYRGIVSVWTKYLKKGGSISFEIGGEQAESVSNILSEKGYSDITVVKDIAGLDRTISAIKV